MRAAVEVGGTVGIVAVIGMRCAGDRTSATNLLRLFVTKNYMMHN